MGIRLTVSSRRRLAPTAFHSQLITRRFEEAAPPAYGDQLLPNANSQPARPRRIDATTARRFSAASAWTGQSAAGR
jgi:hypothetical protein